MQPNPPQTQAHQKTKKKQQQKSLVFCLALSTLSPKEVARWKCLLAAAALLAPRRCRPCSRGREAGRHSPAQPRPRPDRDAADCPLSPAQRSVLIGCHIAQGSRTVLGRAAGRNGLLGGTTGRPPPRGGASLVDLVGWPRSGRRWWRRGAGPCGPVRVRRWAW